MAMSVSCPECGTPLEVDDEYRNWKVRCPRCRHEFPATQAAKPAADPTSNEPQDADPVRPCGFCGRRVSTKRPCPYCGAIRTSADPEPERFRFDDDYRPRRRRRGRRPFDETDLTEAEAEVAAPSLCLELLGWLGVASSIGFALLLLVTAFQAGNNRNGGRQNDDDAASMICLAIACGMFGVPYHIALIVGARKMRHLSSRGWALAASIMATGTFVLFSCAGLLHIAPGIWGLVVLERPKVKRAFKYVAEQNRLELDEDDDDD